MVGRSACAAQIESRASGGAAAVIIKFSEHSVRSRLPPTPPHSSLAYF